MTRLRPHTGSAQADRRPLLSAGSASVGAHLLFFAALGFSAAVVVGLVP
jgi:hypothetical protein